MAIYSQLDCIFRLACIIFTVMVVSPDNLAMVTNIGSSTFARQRTVSSPSGLTIASGRCWCHSLLQNSSIFPGNLTGHVRNCSVRNFNQIGVDDRGQDIVFGEISDNLEEFSANVGLDI